MLGLQRIVAFGLVGLGLGLSVDAAAETTPTCTTALWTFNHEQQSPCFVAASLFGACNNISQISWVISPISPSDSYGGPPSPAYSGPCQCSTVVYSLVSACALCQNAHIGSWSDWSVNCSLLDTNYGTFPLTIPPGVGVPAWAYQNVLLNNYTWDPIAAQIDPGLESSASPSPTSTQIGNTTNTFPSTVSFGPAPTTSNSPSNSSSKLGPIVGGAVGGVVVLALIALVVFFVYRRKTRPQSRESRKFMAANPFSHFVTTPSTAGFSRMRTMTPIETVTPIGAAHDEIPRP